LQLGLGGLAARRGRLQLGAVGPEPDGYRRAKLEAVPGGRVAVSLVLVAYRQAVNVQVLGRSGGKKQLVIPTSALTDLNGKPVVFVHTDPETFKIHYVQPGSANGEQTVLLGGDVNENDRVVSVGTYQLKSIYLNQ
jgi:multidrug efflux pump subunit AcrA (membrane-fusion protein)